MTDYLLAHAVDQLAEANWMFAMVNRDEDAEPPEYPTPLRRPGDDHREEAGVQHLTTAGEVAEFFAP
ncbi:hypothetical protein GCM10010252_10210 [Streptomyces aureoverticillatus]|nr:hypothetical protein GCM10010252_10210 [Streptomyces aureoverticillatus]